MADTRGWQPKRGDRVMLSDQRWATLNNSSKRVGRRGGTVTSLHHNGSWLSANVRWDGLKTPSSWDVDELCPDDPAKHSPPPKVLREQAKVARVKRIKGWQPIETAPRDGTWVLLTGGSIPYGWYYGEPPQVVAQWTTHLNGRDGPEYARWAMAWFDGGYYGEYQGPTHWKPLDPLPAPPEDDK